MILGPRWTRPRVLDVAAAPRWEAGDDLATVTAFDKVAVVAHFATSEHLTRSVRTLGAELRAHGYRVVIMSASPVAGPLRWGADAAPPSGVSIYRRENIGYDFGSWAAALAAFAGLAKAEHVVLCNDSLVGPFAPMTALLEAFESSDVDIWGLTDSTHLGYHLQSYWVGYRGGVLADPAMTRFWGDVRVERCKEHVIKRYELGAMRHWRRGRYRVGVGFPYALVVNEGFNPTSFGWRRLFDFGFPFVKREIAVSPPPEIRDGDQVAAVVAARFDADLEQWL